MEETFVPFDAAKVADRCVQWIRDWFQYNGPGCKAVIGISGGKDSTVAAALCVKALGADRVFGVLMPQGVQSDIEDSYCICHHLGIDYTEVNIGLIVAVLMRIYGESLESELSEQARINIPPRVRMTTLYAISQTLNGRVVNTCNLSEDYVGYSTKFGDNAGDFAPLQDLTSEEVIEVGRALGVPEYLLIKPPADGLCGKTDEDNLGFTYAALNQYIRTGRLEDEEALEKIKRLHSNNLHKNLHIPGFHYSPEGGDAMQEINDAFNERWSVPQQLEPGAGCLNVDYQAKEPGVGRSR